MSRFALLKKFSRNFSCSWFVIRFYLLHPCSFMVYHYLWCFSILLNCYFKVSYQLKVILYEAKITQNNETELL